MEPPKQVKPCRPSPCGPNSQCREQDERAVCSCTAGMLGAPPNCRPECIIHQDCPSNRACLNQRCQDPCVGSCGFNAQCLVHNHHPQCKCFDNHEGDPYAGCNLKQGKCREIRTFHPAQLNIVIKNVLPYFHTSILYRNSY